MAIFRPFPIKFRPFHIKFCLKTLKNAPIDRKFDGLLVVRRNHNLAPVNIAQNGVQTPVVGLVRGLDIRQNGGRLREFGGALVLAVEIGAANL
jgi:hypothetical protein